MAACKFSLGNKMSDQERNYNDLFEIAIINSKPCTGESCSIWAAFKAKVKLKKKKKIFLHI